MADTEHNNHLGKSKTSCLTLIASLTSGKEICSKKDEKLELTWPAANERDLTQIQHEDPTPESYSAETAKHLKIKKVYQKITCSESEDNKILFHDLNQSSLNETVNHEKRKIIDPLLEIDADCSDGSQQINYWNSLSDEIILAIFTRLTRKSVTVCAKVCKRWRRLAYDETFWYSMDLTGSSFSDTVLRGLLMRGVVVLRLAWAEVLSALASESRRFIEGKKETSEDLHYNLQYLDASSCNIKEDNLLHSILKSKNLKNLSLESYSLSTSLLRAIGACDQLSVLNLCMCSNITKAGLCVLSKGCPRIAELNLSWTNLTQECVSQVVNCFPLLIKLNLSGCRETLNDKGIVDLLTTCNHLRSLDISDCILITEASVRTIVGHGKMEELSLSRCYGIPPKCLELFSSLKSLKTLQIFGFLTNAGISVLKKGLPGVDINNSMFSTIARATGTQYKNTVWGMRCETLMQIEVRDCKTSTTKYRIFPKDELSVNTNCCATT